MGPAAITYADVPFREPRTHVLLEPLVIASNLLVAAWVYPCLRTARIRWTPSLDALRPGRGAARPILYYTWHANEQLGQLAFRDCPPALMPMLIGHDGLGSRMVHRATAWYGMPVWLYRRRSDVRPRDQLIAMVKRTGRSIGLLADSGGPYGRVKHGLVDVARATDALLVPFTVRGRPVLTLRRPWRYRVPLPFCSLVVYRGDPIPGRRASVRACQAALEALEARAHRPAETAAATPDRRRTRRPPS